jgi:hypothetical protein
MIIFPTLLGVERNLFLVVFVGFVIGIVGCFIGVGEVYMVTPC